MGALLTKRQNKRAVSRRDSQNKRSGNQAITVPTQGPTTKFTRTVEGLYDVVNDGINPSLYRFNFSLSDLPNYTEFTNLFDMYKIEAIEIEFYPEYTELTDASALSNAVNVQFNSAVDQSGQNAPVAYSDVLQYRSCQSTGITKPHKRYFRPAVLLSSAPASCYVSTTSPSTDWWGLQVGVPPCGVSMTFRSRARFYLSMAQPR